MNRGLKTGVKPLPFLPPWMGSTDPANDGSSLVVDSTQQGGVGLAALTIPTPPVGLWYPDGATNAGNSSFVNGVLYLTAVRLPAGTVDRVQINCPTTAGSAGSVHRLGVYRQRPGRRFGVSDLLADLGTVDTSTTGIKLATANLAIPTGGIIHFLAVVQQGAPATAATIRALSSGLIAEFGGVPFVSGGFANGLSGFAGPAATGALPSAILSVGAQFTTQPWAQVRYA